nr:hypothetical protein Iba_chr06bCG14960 [Ipomoea batatas]GMD08190.1 hypothetical protein Iba_chr06cCG14340 [Ipomoea batatas]
MLKKNIGVVKREILSTAGSGLLLTAHVLKSMVLQLHHTHFQLMMLAISYLCLVNPSVVIGPVVLLFYRNKLDLSFQGHQHATHLNLLDLWLKGSVLASLLLIVEGRWEIVRVNGLE